jgi:hypothetical protein
MTDTKLKKLLKSTFVMIFALICIMLAYHEGRSMEILDGYQMIFFAFTCIGAVYTGSEFGALVYVVIEQIKKKNKRKRKNEIDGT